MNTNPFSSNKGSGCFTQSELEDLEGNALVHATTKSVFGEVDCMSFVRLSLAVKNYPIQRLERPKFLSCENDISIENHLRIQWHRLGSTWVNAEWEKSLNNCKFLEIYKENDGRVGMIGKTGTYTRYEIGDQCIGVIPKITEVYLFDKWKNMWEWHIIKNIESLTRCKINLKPWHLPLCGLIDSQDFLISRISNGLIRIPGKYIAKVWKPIT